MRNEPVVLRFAPEFTAVQRIFFPRLGGIRFEKVLPSSRSDIPAVQTSIHARV
jgi:hypothetical protein